MSDRRPDPSADEPLPPFPRVGHLPPSPSPPPPPGPDSTNRLAIASLVCALVLPGLGSPVAIAAGYVARRQIRASHGRQRGDGLALVAMVHGCVSALGFLMLWAWFVLLNRAA